MKRYLIITTLLLLTALTVPALVFADMADMGNYCSAPPYVTRSVVPNLLVLMDNSNDMYSPAYTDAYTPNSTGDNYIGYFIPQSCYSYSGAKFVEEPKTGNINCNTANCYTSYTYADTCPSTAPFRGNLLNWATMSKYDVLQKVLVGGNSVSKQGNANTLLSIGAAWTKTYNNCVFIVSNANLEITETAAGACTLLDNPAPSGFAFLESPWFRSLSAWLGNRFDAVVAFVALPFKEFGVLLAQAWEQVHLIAEAWAATGVGIQTGTLNGTLGSAYSITFECTGTGSDCPNGTYNWTITSKPAWLTTTTYASQGAKTNYRITLSGTPTATGNFGPFTVSFTVGTKSASVSYTIRVSASPLSITSLTLPTAKVALAYSTTVGGQGGVTCTSPVPTPYAWTYQWSATGLPPGLSIDGSTGVISGTPTSSSGSPYTVVVTMKDCNTPQASVSKTFSLAVNPSSLAITTGTLTDSMVSSPYSATLQGAGGGAGYTWAITSGYLPFGLFLNPLTGVISGTTCPFTSNGATAGVPGDSGATCLKTDQFSVLAGKNYLVSACPDAGGAFTGDTYLHLTGPGGYVADNDDSDCGGTWMLASTLQFNVSSSGTMTLCESAWGANEYPGTTWSYMVKDIDANRSCAGTFPFTASLTDEYGTTVTKAFSITIHGAELAISTTGLDSAVTGTAYTFQLRQTGGTGPYTWTVTGLPANFSYDAAMGVIYGTAATNQIGSYPLTITVTDSLGATASKPLTLSIVKTLSLRSQTFNVKVDIYEETLINDAVRDGGNGNDIFDATYPAESYVDANSNGKWDGKQGIFQEFWDEVTPRARWGLSDFTNQGLRIESCIPASPAASYFTAVQNATATGSAPLASGLYGDINFYAKAAANFTLYDSSSYRGCANADPIDNVPCRKNFVLILSSGSDLSGSAFLQGTAGCNQDDAHALVRNACVGQSTDIRSDKSGKQVVYTYVVNTMGTNAANNAILQSTATAGGGKYYNASQGSDLAAQLKNAINDILGQAASGTAVSVLTTSSRGIGSMVQAYFLPTQNAGPTETRQVTWSGYLQNLWIDPQDNLREDTTNDVKLKLDEDRVVKFFFDTSVVPNTTKAAAFTTDANGLGGTMATCTPAIETFSEVKYLWEAGKKLAYTYPSDRTVFTSSKIIQGDSTLYTFSPYDFTDSTISGNATLKAALNPDADGTSFSASNLVAYVRGECLETGSTGDMDCGATPNGIYRDRRVSLSATLTNYNSGLQKPSPGSNGNVWKLGDIISSTPKVFANTPLNTYHIQYGDQTYIQYVSDTGTFASGDRKYARHSSMAFVGANDGMLHAFRVGYLIDTGLESGVKALFQNLFSDANTNKIGDEVWAYIPFNAFPYLKYLANTAYCHIYYNDLSVRLVDASIGSSTDTATTVKDLSSWRTILIGGMRFGGACSAADSGAPQPPAGVTNVGFSAYYAIDITNPERPEPMWEFTDQDLGYSTSYPGIVRTGSAMNDGNWYVAFGSGSTVQPKSLTDIGRTTTGYVYLLDLKTGALVKKIALDHAGIVGDVLSVDADMNYVSEKIYFGTAYQSAGAWMGKLAGIAIPDQDLASSWTPTVTYLVADQYPFTASPDAALDNNGTVWVFEGSGKYYSDLDDEDGSAQVFVGLKDKEDGTIAYPRTVASLDNTTAIQTTGTVAETTPQCLLDASGNTFSLQDVVTSINVTSTPRTPSAIGWYILFSGGERVISRPLAVGGLVDFLSYVPSSDPCSYGGNSYLYSLGYTTGVAPDKIAIIAPALTGGVTTKGATVTVRNHIDLGPGAPPTGEAIIIPPGVALKKKIQVATGVIVEAEDQAVTRVTSGVVHWLKK